MSSEAYSELWLETPAVRVGDLLPFRRGNFSAPCAWHPIARIDYRPNGETWFVTENNCVCRYLTG